MAIIDMRPVNREVCDHDGEHAVWETGDGEEIAVCKMANNHLFRCLKMMNDATSLDSYMALGSLRGEMAIEAAERAMDSAEEWASIFRSELERRSLSFA